MSEHLEVYKCELCGSIIEVMQGGQGTLVCCEQPMKLMREGTTDAAKEKHVPVIEKIDGGYKVTVGSTPHPMVPEHYIQWIELLADGVSYTRFLKPGDEPTAEFKITADKVSAREYCNLHGHWKASN